MKTVKENFHQEVFKKSLTLHKIHTRTFKITQESLILQCVKKIKARSWELIKSNKRINDKTLKLLIKGIQSTKSIRKLDLRYLVCFDINDSILENFGKSFKNLITIQDITLQVTLCKTISNKGMSSLCQALKRFRFLKRLHIRFWSCCQITDAGFYMLGGALKNLISLQRLSISFRESSTVQFSNMKKIKPGSPQNILESLKNCRSLQTIWLWLYARDSITDATLENFSRAFQKLTSLQRIYIDLTFCRNISDIGLLSLSEGLEKLYCLKFLYLDLFQCAVTETGMRKAKEGLRVLPSLEEIFISKGPSALLNK